jgi:hypothetical protein
LGKQGSRKLTAAERQRRISEGMRLYWRGAKEQIMHTTILDTINRDRLHSVDLTVPADEYVENVLANHFLEVDKRHWQQDELDYRVLVDVTAADSGLEVGEWVHLGGQVYAVCTKQEEVLGRKLWTFEGCWESGLPVKKGVKS